MKRSRRGLILVTFVCFVLVMLISLPACGKNGGDATATVPAVDETTTDSSAAPVDQTQKIIWNVGTISTDPTVAPDLNSPADWIVACKDKINEYTNGQIDLEIYYGGVLGAQPQLFEQVEMGELEVFNGQPMSSNDPRFACWNIPFQFDSLEQVDKAIDNGNGEIYKLAESWMSDHNVHLLGMGAGFMRGYANSKHEVILPQDVRGIKSRVYEDALVRTFWDGLTQTQILAVPDIYSALQTGTVDGLEMMATNLIVNKYDEVVKYYTDIDWQWVNSQMFIVSDKAWSALTPELQDEVSRAVSETIKIQTTNQIKYTDEAYGILENKGIKITRLTPDQRQAWIDYANSQTDKYKEIIGADIYDEYVAAVANSK